MIFTDMEQAIMQGGHGLDYQSKPVKLMGFMQELKEARLIYKQSDLRLTYSEVCEHLYLCILTLEFLSRINQTREIAKQYAQRTTSFYNYSNFRANGTDLYNFMYFITADSDNIKKIFKSDDAVKLRERTHLPLMALNGYLTSLTNSGNRDIYFIMRIEAALNISNGSSKEIRRLLSHQNPSQSEVNNIAYRILNEFRSRMPMFDLMLELERKLSGKLTYNHQK
jgi:hypothetical protein